MADIEIYGAIRSMTGDGKSAYSGQVWDEEQGKFQSQINKDLSKDGLVSAKVSQSFTDAQKSLGRSNIGAYAKPNSGIPKSDLSQDVKTSLGKADSAAPQSSTYTKTQVDNLLDGKQDIIADLGTIRDGASNGMTSLQEITQQEFNQIFN